MPEVAKLKAKLVSLEVVLSWVIAPLRAESLFCSLGVIESY